MSSAQPLTATDAALELARRDFGAFTALVSPWWDCARHHRTLCSWLERVERGEVDRLLVSVPPRHGKSELISVHYPAWYLGRNPDRRVIHASYGSDLSATFSRRARNLVRDSERYRAVFPGVTVAGDSQSVTQWEIAGRRGGLRSVGVGSGVTGYGADLALIDDPIRGAEAADSPVQRDAVWDWWTSDLLTRLHPSAAVVVVGTRWHDDDLIGRIRRGDDAARWSELVLPAVGDDGGALWPERYDAAALEDIRAAVGDRVWQALYQQTPVEETGSVFQRTWFAPRFDRLPEPPNEILRVWTAWDVSLKAAEVNDESAGVTMALDKRGMVYVLNVTAGHYTTPELQALMASTAERLAEAWGDRYTGAYVEDKVAGTTVMQYLQRDHPGLVFAPLEADRDKVTRARGVTGYCESLRVLFPAVSYPWVERAINQLCAFPSGTFDDIVDAFVYALQVGLRQWRPLGSGPAGAEEYAVLSW